MICLGHPLRRRIGRHRDAPIGRSTIYGRDLLQIVACIHCDRVAVKREPR